MILKVQPNVMLIPFLIHAYMIGKIATYLNLRVLNPGEIQRLKVCSKSCLFISLFPFQNASNNKKNPCK